MNKKELIKAVAEQAGLNQADAAKAIDALTAVIGNTLAQGSEVQLTGFGTFGTLKRAERLGRNPATGEMLIIPASRVPKFKAGKNLKDAVANS
ncbi:HU family DNA-binding protein [Conchiformibius steedae DSM 2580]|uniref:HU family DNA-binding protein n=1 Tax=Conchiformibius steedae DSM 2580 TaxID=1121352 RepID=A0AAE9HV21_9NEIS|nr:HU family DNA-binding protein [Conchiformibius steedae]QMT33477.1 HU family DNA-binding protein [Conchiformibius steedae]URD68134.1 HU family DNA-binding protein [Conchiformibius steedae DSM 2580]